jgi:hypothetical protein
MRDPTRFLAGVLRAPHFRACVVRECARVDRLVPR